MSSLNEVNLIGALGADPEVKNISADQVVCRLSVATTEAWNDKNGQKQERTEWTNVQVWGKLAEICGQYLTKGKKVYIKGRLQTRSYEKDGKKQYITEVIASKVLFLSPVNVAPKAETKNDFGQEPMFNSEDEIPF